MTKRKKYNAQSRQTTSENELIPSELKIPSKEDSESNKSLDLVSIDEKAKPVPDMSPNPRNTIHEKTLEEDVGTP